MRYFKNLSMSEMGMEVKLESGQLDENFLVKLKHHRETSKES